MHPIAIECEYRLVFGNGLLKPLLRAQDLALGIMRKRSARKSRQDTVGEYFCTCQVVGGSVGHLIEHACCQLRRQIALRFLGIRIERQCALVEGDLFRIILACRNLSQV